MHKYFASDAVTSHLRGSALAVLLLHWCAAATAPAAAAAATKGTTLKLASWNLEWLLTPATFAELRGHCSRNDEQRRAAQRVLPCDVAAGLERSAVDLAALARQVQRLDADVIAIQEVDGAAAARQILTRYDFCFTGSRALQNNGFAIRRGLPFRCGEDLRGLSQGDTLRRGATLVLYPGTSREMHLLGVHLKSGCARQNLGSGGACERLARQIPALEQWVDAQTRAGRQFAVLGDFNRDLLAEQRAQTARGPTVPALWSAINDGNPRGARLTNTAAGEAFRNCAVGQNHVGYIDYILLGEQLAAHLQRGSFERLTWSASDAWRRKLSDHCPVAIRLRID